METTNGDRGGPAAFSLAGKRILVTGANTGIGQGIAVAIARAGGAVVGAGRSAMDETAGAVEKAGGRFDAVAVDLSDPAEAVAMLDRAWETIGPLDGLVNNAGIIRRADAVDLTEADWDEVMDVNLKSVFRLSQGFARRAIAAFYLAQVLPEAMGQVAAAEAGASGLYRLSADAF